jgi:hypothetical protein
MFYKLCKKRFILGFFITGSVGKGDDADKKYGKYKDCWHFVFIFGKSGCHFQWSGLTNR